MHPRPDARPVQPAVFVPSVEFGYESDQQNGGTMGWFISFLLLGLTIYLLVEVGKCTQRAKEAREEARRVTEDAQERIQALAAEKLALQKDVISLRPFTEVRDTAAEVERLRAEGAALLAKARDEAEAIRRE